MRTRMSRFADSQSQCLDAHSPAQRPADVTAHAPATGARAPWPGSSAVPGSRSGPVRVVMPQTVLSPSRWSSSVARVRASADGLNSATSRGPRRAMNSATSSYAFMAAVSHLRPPTGKRADADQQFANGRNVGNPRRAWPWLEAQSRCRVEIHTRRAAVRVNVVAVNAGGIMIPLA